MAEYQSPNVYVEEVDTGSKPIEGVSTSTAGMVGVTERGPSNVPTLVTSYGEYTRWFGERLDPADFTEHCYLPQSVEGFFANGGKRLYLTRIEAEGAERAALNLHDRGVTGSAEALLLRAAPEGTGTVGEPLYALDRSGVLGSMTIRIGSGSDAEYRTVRASTPVSVCCPLALPLARSYTVNAAIREASLADPAVLQSLKASVPRGSTEITLDDKPLANQLLEIDEGGRAEFRFVQAVATDVQSYKVTLDSPLSLDHQAAAVVSVYDVGSSLAKLGEAAGAGASVALMDDAFTATRDSVIVIEEDQVREARRVGLLSELVIDPAFAEYPSGSAIALVKPSPKPNSSGQLTAAASAGAVTIAIDDCSLFPTDTVIQIGITPDAEYATVERLPNGQTKMSGAGNLILMHPLRSAHAAGAQVQPLEDTQAKPDRPAAALLFKVKAGTTSMIVSDGGDSNGTYGSAYGVGDIIRISTPVGNDYYHTVSAKTDCDVCSITLDPALERSHPMGSEIAERAPLLSVRALDTGAWGNRLRVTIEDEAPGLVSHTAIHTTVATNGLRLSSLNGVEEGSVLEIVESATGIQLGDPVKVLRVDRATSEVTLDATAVLSGMQFATLAGAASGEFWVRSREFRITVRLMRQPDPAVPSRDGAALDREVFRFLSMDPRHTRYVQSVIGNSDGAPLLSDRRPDGESWYVRVSDAAADDTIRQSVRLGPEALVDALPDGRIQPARHPLSRGDDSLFTLDDATYIGKDDANPENRTGLQSLANIDDISIVACPGRTSTAMQNALINHCEQQRFRFAVLDAQSAPHDSIEDIITQRQQYDTKYAALYHPWLLIAQPFPTSAAAPPEFAIPPSGHVVGVFARTDIERGVHKAPANEVVRGVLGVQRKLNKEQHDLLNPHPMNINAIRDFRSESRGIRVYGGRCITSDSDWKYVNVRRLLLFIEKSLNRGLQWVVFEPNADALWSRVRRSITNFLTLVWRNGALEGTKPAEAFFVKCDRTTMTQSDIDSGRLICVVGVAPVKPAEFVIVRIGLWTAHADN